MKLLELEDLWKRRGREWVLRGVSLGLAPGELLAVVGPSGSGKTTLLRLIAGLEPPDRGRVWLQGRDVTLLPPEKRGIGFVFQDLALFPHLTVYENVAFGLRKEERDRVEYLLDLLGLVAFRDRYPDRLSGGQQQRVALARALAPGPRVVLLDEPFSSLDAGLRERTREEVARVLRATGTAALLVTHDQEEALALADRLAVLHQGRIVQEGSPEEVYGRPKTAFVAQFLGGANLVPGEAFGEEADTPLGRVRLDRPARGRVVLAVRPEHIEVTDPERGRGVPARVVARAFKGHDLTLGVEAGGRRFRVQTDYRLPWKEGDWVRVRVREPAVVLELEDKALPESGYSPYT